MHAKTLCLILLGLASSSILAQPSPGSTAVQSQQSPDTALTPLQPKVQNGVAYLCGGIGSDEAASMKQAASQYDLMLTFAASSGAYLADVNVDIADARGQAVLQTTCDGPIMLVSLHKNGTYRIRADAGGHVMTRTARVQSGKKVASVAMAWPVRLVDMGSPATPSTAQFGASPGISGMTGGAAGATSGSTPATPAPSGIVGGTSGTDSGNTTGTTPGTSGGAANGTLAPGSTAEPVPPARDTDQPVDNQGPAGTPPGNDTSGAAGAAGIDSAAGMATPPSPRGPENPGISGMTGGAGGSTPGASSTGNAVAPGPTPAPPNPAPVGTPGTPGTPGAAR